MPNENTRNVQYFAINPDGTTDMTVRDANGDPVVANDRHEARLRELEQQVFRREHPTEGYQRWEISPTHPYGAWVTVPAYNPTPPSRDADGDPIINTTGQDNRRTATEVGIWRENYRRDGGLVEEVEALQNSIAARIHDETQRLYVSEPLGQWPTEWSGPKIHNFILHESGWTEVSRDHAPDVLDRSCIMDTGMDTVTPEFIKEDLACIKKHQPKITIVVCAAANKVFFRSDTYWPDIIETAYAKKQQLPESADAQVSVDRAAVPNPGAVFNGPPF